MFISLTLTPVMCSKILTRKLDASRLAHMSEEIFNKLKSRYVRILNRALDMPKVVLAGFVGLLVLSGLLFAFLPQEFTPREDRGQVSLQIRAPLRIYVVSEHRKSGGDQVARDCSAHDAKPDDADGIDGALAQLMPPGICAETLRSLSVSVRMNAVNSAAEVGFGSTPCSIRRRCTAGGTTRYTPRR